MENINNLHLICNECNTNKDYFGDNGKHLIKINLPSTEKDYEIGNGEGCWFTVSEEVLKAYNENSTLKTTGKLENDSFYYQGLLCGQECPIELRGNKRPVVPLEWLNKNYGESIWK